MAVLVLLGAVASATAQRPSVHYRHSGDMPPGAIGRAQLQRGGPLPGYFQPVQIDAPTGTKIALTAGQGFEIPQAAPRKMGMLIGQVYRFRVTNIPHNPGLEVYPTIEVIDRLYPPLGREAEFPIPVQLTESDLVMAGEGKYVTRVIYLENPKSALPVREIDNNQSWFEAQPGDDPLMVADLLGRPVAILRMGARLPEAEGPSNRFLWGSPPWVPVADVPPPEEVPADAVKATSYQTFAPIPRQ